MIIKEIKRRAKAHAKIHHYKIRYYHCMDATREFKTICGRDTRRLDYNLLNRDEFKLDDGQNCAICRFLLKRGAQNS